jgi:hypothetical protein
VPTVEVARASVPPPETPPRAKPRVEPPPPARAAPASGVTDAEVRALLDRYERAWRTGNTAELRRIGQIADDRQARALAKYLETVRDLDVEVRVLELGASGERRTVRFIRRDRFRDPLGREVTKESPPIEKTIERTPAGLRFAPRS